MANATALTPAVRAEMTAKTDTDLIDAYVHILMREVRHHTTQPPSRLVLEASDLVDVFGKRYAYLVARRCKFELSSDLKRWVRTSGPVEGETQLFPEDFAPDAIHARRSVDPLGLCREFHAGAENG